MRRRHHTFHLSVFSCTVHTEQSTISAISRYVFPLSLSDFSLFTSHFCTLIAWWRVNIIKLFYYAEC